MKLIHRNFTRFNNLRIDGSRLFLTVFSLQSINLNY